MLFYLAVDCFDWGMKAIIVLVLSLCLTMLFGGRSFAASCVDIEFVFARGSGAAYQQSDEWQAFRRVMTKMADRISMTSYRFVDVDYPAVAVSSPGVAVGAYISAGKYYQFGRSVSAGVSWLQNYYNRTMSACPITRWVLAGYSQGAMVVANAVRGFRPDRVIYVGLIGDPQTYLPEGRGLLPDACLGRNYSGYRVYVPTCRTYKGSLGARNPYQYGDLVGKYGLWCARDDYICGSSSSLLKNAGHTQYISLGSYAQLSYLVQQKLTTSYFELAGVRMAVPESEIYAILNQEEYFGRPDDIITLSAAMSFSFAGEIKRYEWAIDDCDFAIGEDEISLVFPLGQHEVRLRITDRVGAQAEAVAHVSILDDFTDVRLAAPVVLAERQADAVYFSWHGAPVGAAYLLVRLNNLDLDYVSAEELVVGVHDLEINEDDVLSVAWMDDDMNVGEEYVVREVDVPEVETLSHEQELRPKDSNVEIQNAPQTGIKSGLITAPVAMVIVGVALIKNTRHLRDG